MSWGEATVYIQERLLDADSDVGSTNTDVLDVNNESIGSSYGTPVGIMHLDPAFCVYSSSPHGESAERGGMSHGKSSGTSDSTYNSSSSDISSSSGVGSSSFGSVGRALDPSSPSTGLTDNSTDNCWIYVPRR